MDEDTLPSRNVNLLLLGDEAVGKTALLQRFLFDTFCEVHQATVEDMYHKQFLINRQLFDVQFLDTSGTYNFPAMRRLNITKATGVIIVFDMAHAESLLQAATNYLQEIRELRGGNNRVLEMPLVVVGNKTDQKCNWELDETQCRQWMEEQSLPTSHLLFTSVKEEDGVWSVFNKLWEIDTVLCGRVRDISECTLGECRAPLVDGKCPDSDTICARTVRCHNVSNKNLLLPQHQQRHQQLLGEKRRFSAFAVLSFGGNGSGSGGGTKESSRSSSPNPGTPHHHHLNQTEAMLEALPNNNKSPTCKVPPPHQHQQQRLPPPKPHKGRLSLGGIFGQGHHKKKLGREGPIKVDCVMQ